MQATQRLLFRFQQLKRVFVTGVSIKRHWAGHPFVWQPFLALFVYASLSSQSKGSIPYIDWCQASGQCGCSAVGVLAPHQRLWRPNIAVKILCKYRPYAAQKTSYVFGSKASKASKDSKDSKASKSTWSLGVLFIILLSNAVYI